MEGGKERKDGRKEGKNEIRVRRKKEDETNSTVGDLPWEVIIELIKNSCSYGHEYLSPWS